MSNVERADAGTRVCVTHEDRAKYKGIAKNPLARKWMLGRLIEAREKAAAAETPHEVNRWSLEADRVAGELKRCGVTTGGEE